MLKIVTSLELHNCRVVFHGSAWLQRPLEMIAGPHMILTLTYCILTVNSFLFGYLCLCKWRQTLGLFGAIKLASLKHGRILILTTKQCCSSSTQFHRVSNFAHDSCTWGRFFLLLIPIAYTAVMCSSAKPWKERQDWDFRFQFPISSNFHMHPAWKLPMFPCKPCKPCKPWNWTLPTTRHYPA